MNTLQTLSLTQDVRLNIFVPQLSTLDVTSKQNNAACSIVGGFYVKIFLEHLVFAVFMSIPADCSGSSKGRTSTQVSAKFVPVYPCSSVV
jgi:hypothetical protein